MGPIEVCTVLRGRWPDGIESNLGVAYVQRLYEALRRHAPPDLNWRFTCLTDRLSIPGVTTKPLPKGLWTWFSKLYAFSPGVFPESSRVLFLDLDTCIVGDWSPLTRVPLSNMVTLSNQWANGDFPATGVMSWITTSDTRLVWSDFSSQSHLRPPYSHPDGKFPMSIRTDEEWLWHYLLPDKWTCFTDLLPGMIASYRIDVVRTMRIRRPAMEDISDLRLIYGHGRPRPHEWPRHSLFDFGWSL
jgi:hypothetical protein